MTSDLYESPLTARYASREMSHLFSAQFKHSTWRRLWIALARAQQELGLPITDAQIAEMEAHVDSIDFKRAETLEKKIRHDVMAHIHTFGEQCPQALPIIHLGATSCYVTDNSELIQWKTALHYIKGKLLVVIRQLADFAQQHRELPCLAFTHYQPAQLTTVGKRACLWLQDFVLDLQDLLVREEQLPFLGAKGTTGTQASFLSLFDGDREKVRRLDRRVCELMGFEHLLPVSGQTYPRKLDVQLLDLLASISGSAHKFCTDLRLLANLKEIDEPFEEAQIGSSAMPYKRNPMRSERVCGLARFVLSLSENPRYTAATQWFERTLDDSANRRLVISEGCLAVDGILNLLINLTRGLIVYPHSIARRIREELPFMATENLLMAAVRRGGNRQEIHERLRVHSLAAGKRVKEEGASNDLIERLAADPVFGVTHAELEDELQPALYTGCAAKQVEEYLYEEVFPLIQNEDCAIIAETAITV